MRFTTFHKGWAALAAVLLLSGAGLARAGECTSGCPTGGAQSGCRACNGNGGCPGGLCRHHCHGWGGGHGWGGCHGWNGCKGWGCGHCWGCCHGMGCCHGGCNCIVPVNPGYSDPRDGQLYAAQGFNVPVAVPLAPCVRKTYNYGWGIPSSRITRVGAQYTKWHPDTLYSQTGGRLVGDQYQTIYQPTDTTQLGFYYVHVPRWGRYGGW